MDALVLETEVLLVDTDQTSPYAVPEAGRESTSMRTVNTAMRALSGSFVRSEPIAFFCECRDPTCFGAVWMTRDMFDATVAGHTDWMLLEGHEPSALWHTRELPPLPVTRGALRAVPDADDGVLKPTSKSRSSSVRQQLARAS